MKLCECGCGQPTNLAKQTDRAKGRVKGQPYRFLKNHHVRLRPKWQPLPPSEPKFCECGCGRPAPIAKQTIIKRGHVRGQALRFVRGHHPVLTIEELFHVHFIPRRPEECWEWQGMRTATGYGIVARPGKHGRTITAHRYSYELHIGPIPEGMLVCHKCDNPPCCNPNHLFIGTIAENQQDMAEKGRSRYGENHWRHKLTTQDVKAIRELYADAGWPMRQLANHFGVSESAIFKTIKRKSWKHVE